MKTVIFKRTIVRIVSFSLAIISVLAAYNIIYMRRLSGAGRQIEYSYRQAVEELAQSADSISATLTKGLYASSPGMMTRLSTELLSEAESARAALARLPSSELDLERTNKFLSQVGAYAYSLSQTAASGSRISYDDYSKLSQLAESAKSIKESLWKLKTRLLTDDSSVTVLFDELDDSGAYIADSFSELEKGLSDSPKLIYDGPFSDHILERTPRLTKGKKEVSREEAREKASVYCGIEAWELKDSEEDELGRMPSYCFNAPGVSCAVTKNGGYISYMVKSREIKDSKISLEEALVYSRGYLDSLGITGMCKTYYETYNNVLTVNYAYLEDDILCYTDLIKVSVALDNGEIVGFDARGFIVNHHERSFPKETVSALECQSRLSPKLSVVDSGLAVIPLDSVNEKLCWELECRTEDDTTVLVYVNAYTGQEEEILILIESEGSALTI